MNEHHEMILEKTRPSGQDEWYCPTCGRRMLVDYGPRLKKVILEAGDEYAIHSGGKGGVQMGMITTTQVDSTPTPNDTQTGDAYLAPWAAWLEEMGFEDLWDNDVQ
jgi:hypothetical protein